MHSWGWRVVEDGNKFLLPPPPMVWCTPMWVKNSYFVTKLKVFLVTNNETRTQDLRSQTITNAMVKPLDNVLLLLLHPPNKLYTYYTLIKPFSFVGYVIPLFKTGADWFSSCVVPWPLGLSLYPTVSGCRDILLGDQFRTKLVYTPPLLTASVELGCKKT